MSSHWVGESLESLLSKAQKVPRHVQFKSFLELGLPVLRRYRSGFLAEMIDIEVCLLMHLDAEQSPLRLEVCCVNETGHLDARIEVHGENAEELLHLFVHDFPEAVMLTAQRKPLCLFRSRSGGLPVEPQSDTKVMGEFMGFLSFTSFTNAVKTNLEKGLQLTVAVP